jgi:hypothetical protein
MKRRQTHVNMCGRSPKYGPFCRNTIENTSRSNPTIDQYVGADGTKPNIILQGIMDLPEILGFRSVVQLMFATSEP